MSDRFEQKIKEWFTRSQTRSLEYLDLSRNPSLPDIACNLDITHTKVCFLSKTVLDNFSQVIEENRRLQKEIRQLRCTISSLEKEVYSKKPLTRKDLIDVVKQPRVIDEEAGKVSQEILCEIKKLHKSVLSVKKLIGGE